MTSNGGESGDFPATGACLCGAIRFEMTPPVAFCAHCHCSMCRRNHGAALVTWIAVPRDRFRMIDGEDVLVRYASSEHGSRSFCGACGSSLFCDSKHHPEQIDIVLANMDAPFTATPQAHIFHDDRVGWIELADSLPRLGGESGLEPVAEAAAPGTAGGARR